MNGAVHIFSTIIGRWVARLLVGQWVTGATALSCTLSVQTTEGYFSCKQRIREAVHDHIDIKPQSAARVIHPRGWLTSSSK